MSITSPLGARLRTSIERVEVQLDQNRSLRLHSVAVLLLYGSAASYARAQLGGLRVPGRAKLQAPGESLWKEDDVCIRHIRYDTTAAPATTSGSVITSSVALPTSAYAHSDTRCTTGTSSFDQFSPISASTSTEPRSTWLRRRCGACIGDVRLFPSAFRAAAT